MRRFLHVLLLALLGIGAARAEMVLNRGNGAEPDSLDPHFAGGTAEENIIADMLMGLTTLDAAARPIPGAAERWDVSADGLTWTFHLRDHTWSDGVKVTAGDFVFAWGRLLDPRTASRYAYNLWVVKNARAISDGKLPSSALGVVAKDARTLVVTLEHPAPYLPELLAGLQAMPLPRHLVTAKDRAWTRPATYVSNGAYALQDWRPNDHVTLVKNPRFYDAAFVRIDRVNFYPTTDSDAALKRYRAGEIDLQSPAPLAQITWLRANLNRELHITPSLALTYIAINLDHPPLNDIRIRRALNLIYNREAIVEKVLKLGEAPAYSYVPPGTANYPGGVAMDFRKRPYAARVTEAQKLMRTAGYGAFNRLSLTFSTSTNPDSRRLAAIFQAMAKPIYIDIRIVTSDFQIHLRNLRQRQFQLGSANWYADFNDPSNFLDLLRSDAGNNYAGYRNPRFDTLMDAAQNTPDLKKRGARLQAAEKTALADYPWLVTRFAAQSDLVKPHVRGWAPNVRDFHRTRWLWIGKKD
jgi:oligopeptide transport system substrate-binding protein